MAIYFSSGAFQTRSPHELIRRAQEYAITHIELSSSMDAVDDFLSPIREATNNLTYLVHNYFPPPRQPFVLNLAASDDETRNLSIEMCKIAIDLCVEFSTPFYSVHSGFALNLKPEDLGQPEKQAKIAQSQPLHSEFAYHTFLQSVISVNDYAKHNGIGLLLENNVLAPASIIGGKINPLLMTRAHEFERLLANVNDRNLGVLLDVAHLKVTATALDFDPIAETKRLAPHIRCLHLSDNDGQRDNNQPIREDSWFLPLLKDFRYSPMVIEAYNLTPTQMRQQRDLLLQWL